MGSSLCGAEMEIRAQLLMDLAQWLEKGCMTQAAAAKVLAVTLGTASIWSDSPQ